MLLSLHILTTVLLAVVKLVCLLVAIAYFTLAERKIMAAVQRRVGPNVVGLIGLLQPLADGLKLAGKEAVVPSQASGRIFMAAAMAVLLFALSGWSTIPFGLFDHSEAMSADAVISSLFDYDRFCNRYNVNSLFSYDHRYGRQLYQYTDLIIGQTYSQRDDAYAVWAEAHGLDTCPVC
jgi:NADH:ubiquinone oxidoreductase subunit H